MIIVDSNEAAENRRLVDSLRRLAEVAVRPLDAGDYFIVGRDGRQALVERKTVFDFLNSLKGRLWEQLSRLREFEGERVIILEGYLGLYRKRGWNEASILALMDTIVHEWGIPIIPTPDLKATLTYLLWKNKSLGEEKEFREYPLRLRSRDMTLEEQALYTLEGLCGHETAKALLRHFKTLGNTIAFFKDKNPLTAQELLKNVKVGGRRIPANTIKRIVEVVNREYVGEQRNGDNNQDSSGA